MQYNGGKFKCAKELALILAGHIGCCETYWEPFVGAANIICRPELSCYQRFGSDIDENMIALLSRVRDGWEPPRDITEEVYAHAKQHPEDFSPEMRAFIGYGCSFGGKWFGGYARHKKDVRGESYAPTGKSSLLKQAPLLKSIQFKPATYSSNPFGKVDLIYCDPPYLGTTNAGRSKFNHDLFWDWCREQARQGSLVYVSEQTSPAFAKCIWEKEFTPGSGLRRKDSRGLVEKLFLVHGE